MPMRRKVKYKKSNNIQKIENWLEEFSLKVRHSLNPEKKDGIF